MRCEQRVDRVIGGEPARRQKGLRPLSQASPSGGKRGKIDSSEMGFGASAMFLRDLSFDGSIGLSSSSNCLMRSRSSVDNPVTGSPNRPAHTCHRENPIKFTWRPMPIHIHFPTGTGGVMSKFERLLEAGSTELPDCRCTAEMHLTAIVPVPGGDTEIRVFRCLNCGHELRLTAWRNDVSAA